MASQNHGIHSFEECVPEGSDYFQQTLGRAHTRRSSTHNKRKEDGKIKLSPSKEDPSSNEEYEEPLIHLSIWIRNDATMNEEDDEAESSRISLPSKQIKINIQLSFHYIILHSVFVLCMIGCLH